jgi:hypothetical protein
MRQIYRVERVPHGKDLSGDNWLIADFGRDMEDNCHYYLTTNYVHASELGYVTGSAREECEACAEMLNNRYNHRQQRDWLKDDRREE